MSPASFLYEILMIHVFVVQSDRRLSIRNAVQPSINRGECWSVYAQKGQ